jgi:hypothetical protein
MAGRPCARSSAPPTMFSVTVTTPPASPTRINAPSSAGKVGATPRRAIVAAYEALVPAAQRRSASRPDSGVAAAMPTRSPRPEPSRARPSPAELMSSPSRIAGMREDQVPAWNPETTNTAPAAALSRRSRPCRRAEWCARAMRSTRPRGAFLSRMTLLPLSTGRTVGRESGGGPQSKPGTTSADHAIRTPTDRPHGQSASQDRLPQGCSTTCWRAPAAGRR